MRNWHCIDCEVDTYKIDEYYMVHDKVWKQAGMDKGMLCIGCLEERIGRILNTSDFIDLPINTSKDFARSPRLEYRLLRMSFIEYLKKVFNEFFHQRG